MSARAVVRNIGRECAVLALFLALAAAHTRIGSGLGTRIFDHVDSLQDAWVLHNVTENVWRRPLDLFEGNNYFPSRDAVLFCDPLLGPAALVAILRAFTDNPILVYNAAVLAVLALSSYGWWRLAHALSGDRVAALLAAVAIPYTPQLASHVYQLNLLTSAGYPFLWWGLLRLVERPSWRTAAATGAAFAFQAGTGGYHAFACTFLALVVAAWGWRRLLSARVVAASVAAAALAALLLAPYVLGQLGHRGEADLSRPLHWAESWSLDLATGLWSSHTYLWRGLMPDHGLPVFPGLIVTALALVGAWRVRSPHARLLLAVFAVFFVLALGPQLRVFGHTLFPLPYLALRDSLPFFSAARRAGFFFVPAAMALGLLAVLGLRAVAATRHRLWTAAAVVLAVAESAAPAFPRRAYSRELPDAHAWLLGQPAGAVLELPAEDGDNMTYQWWSNFHRRPTANGVSAFEPNWYRDLTQAIRREWKRKPAGQDMTSWTSTAMLRSLPFRYLILQAGVSGYARSHVDATSAVFRLVHESADGTRVYTIDRGAVVDRPVRRRFRDDQLGDALRLRFDVEDGAAEVQIRLNDGEPRRVELALGAHEIAPPLAPRVRGVNTMTIERTGGGRVVLRDVVGD